MSKRYNIRWRQNDETNLKKAVRNYNAKISRLEKKLSPDEKSALPQKMTVKQLKELIETRQDLNREINALQRFTRRGAEELIEIPDNKYNLKITKWQFREQNRRNTIINTKRRKRALEFLNLDMKQGSTDLGYKLGELGMGKAEEVALRQTEAFPKDMNRRDLNKRYLHFLAESQSTYFDRIDERFREVYINNLKLKYNPNDIEDIIESIQEMDYKEFYKEIQREGGVKASLEWTYPPKPGTPEYNGYIEHLRDKWNPNWWEKAYGEELNK